MDNYTNMKNKKIDKVHAKASEKAQATAEKLKETVNAKQQTIQKVFNALTLIGIIAAVVFCVYAYRAGWFTSEEALKLVMQKLGFWAPVVFVLIQIVQVVIPIIPGGISCLAGVMIFGPLWGFVYNYVGISIGSVINFILARSYGKPFVQNMVSQKTFDKYIGWLDKGKRFDRFFALAIFFPCAPDDFLCMLAGLTKMTLKKFTLIILLGKPASIFAYSLGLSTIMQWVLGFLK